MKNISSEFKNWYKASSFHATRGNRPTKHSEEDIKNLAQVIEDNQVRVKMNMTQALRLLKRMVRQHRTQSAGTVPPT